jgi:hypothetical protein
MATDERTPTSPPSPANGAEHRARPAWDRLLPPLTGVGFVVLVILSLVIAGDPTDASHPADEVVDWYTSNTTAVQIGAYLQAMAAALLIFFAGYLRRILRAAEGENGMLSLISFAGAVMISVGAAIDATIMLAAAERADDISPESVQTLQALWDNDFIPFAVGTLAFVWATGLSILRHGALNRWFGWSMIVFGVVAVSPLGFFAFMATGIWILVLSITLLVRGDPTPTRAHARS